MHVSDSQARSQAKPNSDCMTPLRAHARSITTHVLGAFARGGLLDQRYLAAFVLSVPSSPSTDVRNAHELLAVYSTDAPNARPATSPGVV